MGPPTALSYSRAVHMTNTCRLCSQTAFGKWMDLYFNSGKDKIKIKCHALSTGQKQPE